MSDKSQQLVATLERLTSTLPLPKDDPLYVQRTDKLGNKLLNRLRTPTSSRLLLAGPAGCGKSTELLQIVGEVGKGADVVLGQCDRDLDLFRVDVPVLLRYLLWRVLCLEQAGEIASDFTDELKREIRARIHLQGVEIESPRRFFTPAGLSPRPSGDLENLLDTWERVLLEIHEIPFAGLILILDGLEKVPEQLFTRVVPEFIRLPFLDRCQSVFVIPNWSLYGSASLRTYPDTEVLQVRVDESPAFVRKVLQRRSKDLINVAVRRRIAEYSGGVVRDALQIAKLACRLALDEEASDVGANFVEAAVKEIREDYALLFSDDLDQARQLLQQVRATGSPPAIPGLRDRMLASGAILPREDGAGLFRIHPLVAGPPFFPQARAA